MHSYCAIYGLVMDLIDPVAETEHADKVVSIAINEQIIIDINNFFFISVSFCK